MALRRHEMMWRVMPEAWRGQSDHLWSCERADRDSGQTSHPKYSFQVAIFPPTKCTRIASWVVALLRSLFRVTVQSHWIASLVPSSERNISFTVTFRSVKFLK